ncbi:hypothetical protein [Mangrovimonas sp. YM274]|uniref:hypothetical protein n=1 Tax=Mangrovimonas sp. YM274 TaxID=3070660 RepID=UPI0027DD6D89|nr:hypothetical protein [Mangrovimonas sp. YM274]WMI69211.1 hypothetical protein RBH95_02280 [Mangrovimonas sp. YM274]
MKTRVSFLLAMVLGLSLFNCGPDSDDNDNNNEPETTANALVYDGEEYQLKNGYILNYGEMDVEGVYTFEIYLLDTNYEIMWGELIPENNVFSGLSFELFTENPAGLEPGTYNYTSIESVPNTFDYGDMIINLNYEMDEEESFLEITSGTVTILENGTTYKLEFEGTTDEGLEFSGNYEGELEEFVYSDEFGRIAAGATKTKGFSRRK